MMVMALAMGSGDEFGCESDGDGCGSGFVLDIRSLSP